MENKITFKAVIERLVGEYANDFRIYACTPIEEVEGLKYNKYGNISISGNIHALTLEQEYEITGRENKYGYEIIKIKREKPTNKTQTSKFLAEVVTQKQAKSLLSVYPDIVSKIIDNNLEDIDLKLVSGVKDITFDKIKKKVIENFPLMEFIEEFSQYNIGINNARKMYSTFSSVELMREKMNLDPYSTLCLIGGIGFKKADTLILKANSESGIINSPQRMRACVKYVLTENEACGNTWISLESLIEKCEELTPQCMDSLLESLSSNDVYIDKVNRRIGFKKAFDTEKYICKSLIESLKVKNKLLIDVSKYYRINGFELGDEQKQILSRFCNNNINLLVGNAGSGKSSSVQAIINLCDDNDLSYTLMTPTGKSAIVLSNFTKRDAGTIHRKLCFNPSEGWGYNLENKLKTDVVIVDENGMTDIWLMKHLLDAIDIKKTRILFVQDDAQLPSVSCGNCAYDFINSEVIPTTRLNKVFRYGEGGLLQVATKIRKGERFLNDSDDIQVFGNNKDYTFVPSEDKEISEYVVGLYQKLINQGVDTSDILVLSANNVGNNGTIMLNQILQERFNPHKDGIKWIKYGETIFRENDIVMQVVNDYKAENESGDEVTITNGEIGKIIKIDWNKVYVKYDRDTIIYGKDDLNKLLLAYSISIHKSQGSSVDNVILVSPRSQVWTLNKNLLYVGLTRARKKAFHIGLQNTINGAIKKSAELQRNTFSINILKEMLKEL